MGDGMARRVGFSVRVEPIQKATGTTGPDEEKMEKLHELKGELLEGLDTMMDYQAFLRSREEEYRNLQEATFSRVMNWTFAEFVVLLAIGGGQIIYLRRFFESR